MLTEDRGALEGFQGQSSLPDAASSARPAADGLELTSRQSRGSLRDAASSAKLTSDRLASERLQDALGYHFRDPLLLDRCLTHVSIGGGMEAHNETLEFLGDAVLGLAISDMLMRRFPEKSEGDLSRMRASLVNRKVLAEKARAIDIGAVLRMGKGEERTGGRRKPSILAASLEALLGGIYRDAGYDAVRLVVERHFAADLDHTGLGLDDYKTRLQEVSQRLYRVPPTYRLVRETGPSHDRCFETETRVAGHLAGQGEGRSKKQSEQEAARRALEMLLQGQQQ